MKPPDDMVVDHINGDKLDNRKENLRICTQAENSRNRVSANLPNKSSLYQGVSYREDLGKWRMQLTYNYEKVERIWFTDEIACANCWNYYAKLYYKEFAKPNNVPYMTKEEWEKYIYIPKDYTTSHYTGVFWDNTHRKWKAHIEHNKKYIHIGFFEDEDIAAYAYNHTARELRGENAKLNILKRKVDDSEWIRRSEPTSKYIGVSWDKQNNHWFTAIGNRHQMIYLGRYESEEVAANVYNHKYKELNGGKEPVNKTNVYYSPEQCEQLRLKKKKSSTYTGVSKQSKGDGWQVVISKRKNENLPVRYLNTKNVNIGTYPTEIEAAIAYNNFVIENNLDRKLNEIVQ